jgi:HK97 family phage major capsid protein
MTKRPRPEDIKIAHAMAGLVKGNQAYAQLVRRSGLTEAQLDADAVRQRRLTRAMLDDDKVDPTGKQTPRFNAAIGIAGDLARFRAARLPRTSNIVHMVAQASRSAPQPRATAMRTYRNFGDYLQGVRAQALSGRADPRVVAVAPSTAGNEGTGADGGILVPTELAREVIGAVMQNSIVGRCRTITTSKNATILPIDDEAPWLASGVSWRKELDPLTARKQLFSMGEFRLNELVAMVPVSNELLEDSAAAFDSWARVEVPRKIAAKLTTAIIRGDGVAKLRGILSDPALISVARGGSVAATAAAMWKRMYGAGRGSACWLVNPDIDIPTTPGLPLLLHGREVIAVEALSATGTAGDMILADLSQYALIARALQAAVSMHIYFDADASCYRFILRCTGQGLWDSPVQPENGAVTLSPFVTVAT